MRTDGHDRYARAGKLLAAGHTQVEVADEVGISARQLRRWIADGIVSINGNGNGHKSAAADTGETLADLKRRKEKALTEKHEIEVARMRGELIEKREMVDTLHVIRRALESAPREAAAKWRRRSALHAGVDEREALALAEDIVEIVRERVVAQLKQWADEE